MNVMDIAPPLFLATKEQYAKHLLSLSKESRRTRFCIPASDFLIESFVNGLRSDDIILGLGDGVAYAVLCWIGDSYEVGLSVADEHQGMGYGKQMFSAIMRLVGKGSAHLTVHCLRSNTRMVQLTQSCGGILEYDAGEVTGKVFLGERSE